jgi:hypothetical protein
MEDRRGAYRVLAGTADERRPLGRHRSSWENYITLILEEVGLGRQGRYWIALAYDREDWRAVVNAVMNLRFT